MAKPKDNLPADSSDGDVAAFLDKVARTPMVRPGAGKGRLIFAMDATGSRRPTWDIACGIQAEMFQETGAIGRLQVQLAYYRGFHEFYASPFADHADGLLRHMTGVDCRSGKTQIERVLRHALHETDREKVNALVFVGDACEEDAAPIRERAGQLGLRGVPAFVFHEGDDPHAGAVFHDIARLSGGAYCHFDLASARTLRDLLSAVAVYAVGGYPALEDFERKTGRTLLRIANRKTAN